MFGGLRQGNLLYILDKGVNGAVLKVAQVESVSNPQCRYGQMAQYVGDSDKYVDVKARAGEETLELKQLSCLLNIANCGNLVVSDSRETMNAEVEALMRTSRQALDSMQYHEKMITDCDAMLRELNPQFARDKEHEEKIDALEGKMGRIEGTLCQIQSMLSTLTSKKN